MADSVSESMFESRARAMNGQDVRAAGPAGQSESEGEWTVSGMRAARDISGRGALSSC